jgi:hypothetical protein
VIIAWFKLYLNPHVAGDCGPDERVPLRDAAMGDKVGRYIGLLAKNRCDPFTHGVLSAGEHHPNSRESGRRDQAYCWPSATLT